MDRNPPGIVIMIKSKEISYNAYQSLKLSKKGVDEDEACINTVILKIEIVHL